MALASGLPSTMNITTPAISVATSGISDHRHESARPGRDLPSADPERDAPAIRPPIRPPRKPSADEAGDRAQREPGCDARAVGDRVRDVAGQRGHQEAERQSADLEEHCAEVVEQRCCRTSGPPSRPLGTSGRFVIEPAPSTSSALNAISYPASRKPSAISRPPAATNGIMYETPVSSHWRSLMPRCTSPEPWLADEAAEASPATRGSVRVGRGGDCLGDHLVRLVDRSLHAGRHDRLAGEPAPVVDTDVGREDHRVRASDDLVAERLRRRSIPGSRRAA